MMRMLDGKPYNRVADMGLTIMVVPSLARLYTMADMMALMRRDEEFRMYADEKQLLEKRLQTLGFDEAARNRGPDAAVAMKAYEIAKFVLRHQEHTYFPTRYGERVDSFGLTFQEDDDFRYVKLRVTKRTGATMDQAMYYEIALEYDGETSAMNQIPRMQLDLAARNLSQLEGEVVVEDDRTLVYPYRRNGQVDAQSMNLPATATAAIVAGLVYVMLANDYVPRDNDLRDLDISVGLGLHSGKYFSSPTIQARAEKHARDLIYTYGQMHHAFMPLADD